jgi:r-opsin
VVPPLFGWNRFMLEGFNTTCTFDYISKDSWSRLYIVILTVGGFLIPLSVILVSYIYILVKLSERSRRLMTPPNSDDQNGYSQLRQAYVYYFRPLNSMNDEQSRGGSTRISEPSERDKITRNIRRTEARATRTSLIVCAIFCIAWGPYSLLTVLSQLGFDHCVNPYTTAMLGLCTKIAACINPLIYALSSSAFRHKICLCLNFLYSFMSRKTKTTSII